MEMESTRRSIERSKEPGLKKPRLAEEAERNLNSNGVVVHRDRPLATRVSPGAGARTGPLLSRLRTNDKKRDVETDDPVRGAYQQQQQYQELVNQYKTALAELTFNSKPIITNLTIITGENLQAAKGIAATVLANILEVPSEQKLPSLYLLDSIVKNIGRDYIKYFAARLPEVFCKAYRQVDSSIHPNMRHLFGTWKGVFPSATLQMIEKELGLPPKTSVSSSDTAVSRPDSQTQRPPHSIHVNPKYLEARQQRLQQSSKAKGTIHDSTATAITSEDAERPDRAASIGSGRPWAELHVKMPNVQRPQREASNDSLHEKSGASGYGDYERGSDLSKHHQDFGIGRGSERTVERGLDKSRYVAGSNVTDAVIGQRNGFDIQHGFPNFRAPKSEQAFAQLQPTQKNADRGSTGNFRNWKNSEEEEYTWDDMNSRLTDYGSSDSARRDDWTPDDVEKQEVDEHTLQPWKKHDVGSRVNRETSTDPRSIAQRGQATSVHRTPSVLPIHESHSVDHLNRTNMASIVSGHTESHPTSPSGLSTSTSLSSAWVGPRSHIGSSIGVSSSFGSLMSSASGSLGTFGEPRHQPLGPPSPSRQFLQQRVPSPSSSATIPHTSSEQDHQQAQSFLHTGPKSFQLVGQLNRVSHIQNNQDPFPILPQNHIQQGTFRNPLPNQSQPPQYLQPSSSSSPFSYLRHHSPFSSQLQSDLTNSQPSGQAQKPLPLASVYGTSQTMGHSVSSHLNNPAVDIPGRSSTSSLLAAIMNSGLLSNKSITGNLPNLSFQESGALPPHSNIQPPLPSGPPPSNSSPSMGAPTSVFGQSSHGNTPASTTQPQGTAARPPLPPGPPPPSSNVGSMSSQMSSASSAVPNPFSSLLSSLVAKGLISSSTTESPTPSLLELDTGFQNQNSGISDTSSLPVTSSPTSSTIPPFPEKNLPLSESQTTGTLSHGSAAYMGLIGIEFKPEIIREVHPSVISSLFDDLPHCCSICGLRVKHQEQLDRHLEWHASKKPELSGLNKMSRRWYTYLGDWSTGSVGLSSGSTTCTASVEELVPSEKSELMVPADESQCVCTICGELFEDFYSHERDKWMFKGAVYMIISAGKSVRGTADKSAAQGPIVHASCISESSVYDLGLAKRAKVEPTEA